MTIQELRLKMMKTKKTNPEESKVLQSLLASALLIAKEDGNRDAIDKDIVSAAKKEFKMAEQSRDAGAPYNIETFNVCSAILPKVMSESETRIIIESIIKTVPEKSMKAMGGIMKKIKTEYGDTVNSSLASKIIKELLS